MYEGVKHFDSSLVTIAPTFVNNFNQYQFASLAPFADVFSRQLLTVNNPRRQDVAFYTKQLVDQIRKPVWPCNHIENYMSSFSPEETVELFSQVFRAGGEGQIFYFSDRNSRVGKNGTLSCYWGAPSRWNAYLHLSDIIRAQPRLRFPQADTAILLSVDTCQSRPYSIYTHKSTMENAGYFESFYHPLFTVLGPRLGNWFDFVSDEQVESGMPLERYKVIYVPYAPFAQESVYRRIREYVAGGGTLVCGTPDTFRYALTGDERTTEREEFLGCAATASKQIAKIILRQEQSVTGGETKELPCGNEGVCLKLNGCASVLARDESGNPAASNHPYGKGRVIVFGINPFLYLVETETAWEEWIRELQEKNGCRLAQPIWHFRFPLPLGYEKPEESLRCLTGNFFEWVLNDPQEKYNECLSGSYSYTIPPDLITDVDTGSIPFGKGKLTNRLAAIDSGDAIHEKNPEAKFKSKFREWVVGWSGRGQDTAITFDFGQSVFVKKLRIFFNGTLPAFRVETGDSKLFSSVLEHKSMDSNEHDVQCLTVDLPINKKAFQTMRLVFERIEKPMTIGEIDIWGSK